LGLEVEDFIELTNTVSEIARTYANGRLVSVLEGGYHPQRLAECVEVHLQTLLQSDQHQASAKPPA
jgi:acetoin utilization deacetylase AcuC-like enzyme